MCLCTGKHEALSHNERRHLHGQSIQDSALSQHCLMGFLRAQFPDKRCSKFNGRLILMATIVLAEDVG